MKPPRYLGTFNDAPVYRIDSDAAGVRVWRGRWRPDPKARRPGVLIEQFGAVIVASPLIGSDDFVRQCRAEGLDALCSTPRLARVLRARYVQARPGLAS